MNTVAFPGLSIGPFEINPIAFSVFGHNVAWYGVIITFGMVLAFLYVLWRAKLEQIKSDDIFDLAICVIIFSIIGARLYYVLTKLENYHSLYDVIATWHGGLAIYGGLIGGGLAAFVFAKIKKLKFTKLFDMMAPAAMLGQLIGRWGNFINAEAYGEVTTLPWRMYVQRSSWSTGIEVHPTFLYESLWNLVGFIIINLIYKKKKYDGQIFLFYITWYGFGRMLIEGLRTDSLYIFETVRISQLVGFLCFTFGLLLLFYFGTKYRNRKSVFAYVAEGSDSIAVTTDEISDPDSSNDVSDAQALDDIQNISDTTDNDNTQTSDSKDNMQE